MSTIGRKNIQNGVKGENKGKSGIKNIKKKKRRAPLPNKDDIQQKYHSFSRIIKMVKLRKRNKKLYYTIVGFVIFSLAFLGYYAVHTLQNYTKPERGEIQKVTVNQNNMYIDENEEVTGEELKCIAFDCGDALCVLIDIGSTEVVYDTGYAETGKDMAKKMEPYVDGDIEYMVISHSHADHIGGAKAISEKYGIGTCITSGELDSDSTQAKESMDALKEKCKSVIDDDNLSYDLGNGARLNIYENLDPKDTDNINDLSVIATVKYGDSTILLTGDAESTAEKNLKGKFSNVTLLIGGHHMSATANTAAILQEWNPQYIFVSCKGKDSEYGFPHKAALERALTVTNSIYGTFKNGDLIYITNGDEEEIVFSGKNEEPLTLDDCTN